MQNFIEFACWVVILGGAGCLVALCLDWYLGDAVRVFDPRNDWDEIESAKRSKIRKLESRIKEVQDE